MPGLIRPEPDRTGMAPSEVSVVDEGRRVYGACVLVVFMSRFARIELPLLAFVCAVLWGSAFPAIKAVYAHWGGAESVGVRLLFAGTRFMLAGLLLVPVRGNPLRAVRRGTVRPLMAIMLTQTFLQYVLFYNGLAVSGGVLGSLLVSAGSFWWVLLAPVILGQPKPTRRQWLALLVCAAGMMLAVWRPGAGAGNPLLGAALFLGSSLSGSLGAIAVAGLGSGVRATHATALSLFFGGVLLALCGIGEAEAFARLFDLKVAVLTLYLAAVSASAFSLWNHLVQRFSARILAGYRFLIPLCGVVLSATFVPGESIGWGAAIGGLLVTAALVHAARERQPG